MKKRIDIRMGEDYCPACNHVLDTCFAATNADHKPDPGDLTICGYCSAMLEFSEDFALILLSEEKFNAKAFKTKKLLLNAQLQIKLNPYPPFKYRNDERND